MFGILPHQFLELDVFQQNLAVLCCADLDAAVAMQAKGAMPIIDLLDVL